MNTATNATLTSSQASAMRKLQALRDANDDRFGRRRYTAQEIGAAGSTLRSLAAMGLVRVGTFTSSIRGGDRNTYGLTLDGKIAARRLSQEG